MRPLNLAFFVGEFPKISETFILNQVQGMIERGHQVTVYGEPPSTTALLDPIIRQYQSRWRARFRPAIPVSRTLRSFGAAGLLLRHGWRDPALVACSLHFLRHGRCSASLKLLYSAMPFWVNPRATMSLAATSRITGCWLLPCGEWEPSKVRSPLPFTGRMFRFT